RFEGAVFMTHQNGAVPHGIDELVWLSRYAQHRQFVCPRIRGENKQSRTEKPPHVLVLWHADPCHPPQNQSRRSVSRAHERPPSARRASRKFCGCWTRCIRTSVPRCCIATRGSCLSPQFFPRNRPTSWSTQ